MSPKTDEPDLTLITGRTLGHYSRTAIGFREGTWDHDVTQNYRALIDALPERADDAPRHRVLDLGCGPGRDLLYFTRQGIEAVGLDGSEAFVNMARQETGCEVWHQNFLALDLPDQHFDGIFANASLFHVPSRELPRVLAELYASLKPGGVLFSSNPRGQNQEGFNGERYGCYHDLDGWRDFCATAGFDEIHHYYRPQGLPREQQNWLASVWRRPA